MFRRIELLPIEKRNSTTLKGLIMETYTDTDNKDQKAKTLNLITHVEVELRTKVMPRH